MGSPLETTSWNGVEGAYYTGAGTSEPLWLFVSIGICVVALIIGAIHESHSYNQVGSDD